MLDDYAPPLTRTIRALSSKQFPEDTTRRTALHQISSAALGGFWPSQEKKQENARAG
jgi:hypothetical protein